MERVEKRICGQKVSWRGILEILGYSGRITSLHIVFCPSQSYFKISIRGRINFISLHGCRSKSLFFLDMRQNFCSFNCTVVLKIAVVKS